MGAVVDQVRALVERGHAEIVLTGVDLTSYGADLPGKPSPSYVVAHDLRNGNQRWKMMRMTSATHESCDSYVTPILWKNGDRLEVAVLGGLSLDAIERALDGVSVEPGRPTKITCFVIDGQTYSISKGLVTVAQLEDEWFEDVADPESVIRTLSGAAGLKT